MLNGLPWKRIEIILLFLRLQWNTACQIFFFFYYEGYSISSKGLLPTVVDIMVIWIKFSHSSSFQFAYFLKCWCSVLPSPVWPLLIYLGLWHREGDGTPLQYSCLENTTDGGDWWAIVHGVVKSRTWLSDFTFTFMHWRRKWQPTPVFLPGESQGWGSLVGCHLWAHTESDTTELTWTMDLKFQVPIQYCHLQHWTLFSPPDTPTTGDHFRFALASLFFLELFPWSSLGAFNSIQFSRSVVSDSLRPYVSQHARPPCPSPTPGVH